MNTLPEGFIKYIIQYPQLAPLAQSLLSQPEVSIRINTSKSATASSSEIIKAALCGEAVPWCEDGYYLADRPKFTFDPALHQGIYYVQDASSMAITAAIRQIAQGPVRYLDACAAPGGKTTAAISTLAFDSLVVANEYDYKRVEVLAENVTKWGAPNVVISRGDTAKIAKLKNFFDIIAVDAPCSGEGMMRKDEKARQQWSESLINECAALQRSIIKNVWEALRPGGHLIYSTCTFNRKEDEENVQWIIDEYDAVPVEITALSQNPDIERGIDVSFPCYRFLPGRVKGEGLFMAVLQKPGQGSVSPVKPLKIKKSAEPADIAKWLNRPVVLYTVKDTIYALPQPLAPEMIHIASVLDVISMGVAAAIIKGRDIVPTHNLALSTALRAEAFAHVDVSRDDALKYLQRENITLPPGTPKGYVLIIYDSVPLGFVKNLGQRSNNLMPKNWRILSKIS